MALVMIKIEKEDIKTFTIGCNYGIETPLFHLIFSPEALEELLNDYQAIKTNHLK